MTHRWQRISVTEGNPEIRVAEGNMGISTCGIDTRVTEGAWKYAGSRGYYIGNGSIYSHSGVDVVTAGTSSVVGPIGSGLDGGQ